MPEFFDRYINMVEDIDVLSALSDYADITALIGQANLHALDGKRYAPEKWTIKNILQHLIDVERIMAYRSLRFARKDSTKLPGFEEDDYEKNSQSEKRTFDDLLDEFSLVRDSTIALFKSFTPEMLQQEGICFNKTTSVLSIGFILAGHPLHHVKIIKERYMPLIR